MEVVASNGGMNLPERSETNLLQRAKRIGKRYQNPVPVKLGGFSTVFKVLPKYLSNKEETEPKQALGPFTTDTSAYASVAESGLRVTWFGHSQLLVEIGGFRVLVDPVWELRASPFTWMGPKRFFAPTLSLESLANLDVVRV
jgi:hypothetical protein